MLKANLPQPRPARLRRLASVRDAAEGSIGVHETAQGSRLHRSMIHLRGPVSALQRQESRQLYRRSPCGPATWVGQSEDSHPGCCTLRLQALGTAATPLPNETRGASRAIGQEAPRIIEGDPTGVTICRLSADPVGASGCAATPPTPGSPSAASAATWWRPSRAGRICALRS